MEEVPTAVSQGGAPSLGNRGKERGREEGREETGIGSPLHHPEESMRVRRIPSSREQGQEAAIPVHIVATQQLMGLQTAMAANTL